MDVCALSPFSSVEQRELKLKRRINLNSRSKETYHMQMLTSIDKQYKKKFYYTCVSHTCRLCYLRLQHSIMLQSYLVRFDPLHGNAVGLVVRGATTVA